MQCHQDLTRAHCTIWKVEILVPQFELWQIWDLKKVIFQRAVPFHPLLFDFLFYHSLFSFPDVLNRSGGDCLMRKQTFASALDCQAAKGFKKLRNEIEQKKRVEKAIRTCVIEFRYSKNSNLSGRDTRPPPPPNNPVNLSCHHRQSMALFYPYMLNYIYCCRSYVH